jgi:hypothetical protein
MFEAIWTHADFDGCFQWDPDALAMKGLPRDAFDPTEAMARLEHDGFLRSYCVGEQRYGYVVNWHKHQDPHPGEKPVHPRPSADPFFIVKVKDYRWRKAGDTAFDHPEIERGLYPWLQLASNLQGGCPEVAEKLPATDKVGKEGKEGKDGEENLSQEGTVTRLEHTPTEQAAHRTREKKRPAKAPSRNLEQILGPHGSDDGNAYWKLVGVFGAAKNPAPTQTAQAFVNAKLKVEVHSILAKAQNLRDSLSDSKYMPQLQKWLDGQGYLNPDAPTRSSEGSRSPAFRVGLDEEWAKAMGHDKESENA